MHTIPLQQTAKTVSNTSKPVTDIIEFYNEATTDYQFWSKSYNMHFGFFKWFTTNPFKRDTMLNEMNRQVLKRVGLLKERGLLADLGCGVGGTMRYALTNNKKLTSIGITLSKFQMEQGNRFLKHLNGVILCENYDHTSLANSSCDGAIAMESFCHGGHHRNSFAEAYRILKPCGRLVIGDAFLKTTPEALCPGGKYFYKNLCTHWNLSRLGSIAEVTEELKKVGFSKVKVEHISFNVAPSVLHVPFAIFGFALKNLFNKESLKKESLHNLKGSFYALLCGLQLKSFGYYLITCIK